MGASPLVLATVVALPVLLFFRDPERTPEGGENAILAPADGKVIDVCTKSGGHPLAQDACQRISIFMSPLDVHVNRTPVTGLVEEISYRKGRFRAAYAGDASEVNESSSMRIRTAGGTPVVVVQIAGWLARRIVCRVARGARVIRGERFGLIMFGSRVDVYLPASASITATPSQRVWAGRTVIGTLDRAAERTVPPERVS
jgi:phosphatidylserine decarboxylase